MPAIHSTTHKPTFEVMQICVEFYFEDIRGKKSELERAEESYLALRDDLNGIDYSEKLGVQGGVLEDEKMLNRLEALLTYLDVLEQVKDDIKQAKDLVNINPFGFILWQKYVTGLSVRRIAYDLRVGKSTVCRHLNDGIEWLYSVMPEEYRRYAIPNAEIF